VLPAVLKRLISELMCACFNKTLFAIVEIANAASPWSSCGQPSDHIKVTNVVLNPDPPVRATACNITMYGSSDETITGGTMNLMITYLGIPVYQQTTPVCQLVPCPYAATANAAASLIVPASAVPSIAPSGTYVGVSRITDQNGAELTCIQLEFTLP